MPLELVDCPLMTSAKIEIYNELEAQVERLRSECPDSLDADDLSAVMARLEKIRKQMRRPTILLGLLGGSQDGKSTTGNSLVNCVTDGDEPFSPGAGRPATSTVTRLLAGDSFGIELRYMTPEEFSERRQGVIGNCGIDPALADDVCLGLLDGLRGGGARNDLETHRHQYCVSLLRSNSQRGKALIRPEPDRYCARGDSGDYKIRFMFTNHNLDNRTGSPLDATSSKLKSLVDTSPLLREVCLTYPTEFIDRRLELVDLPGYGTILTTDDALTEKYIRDDLDGALVFVTARQLSPAHLEKIWKSLSKRWPKLDNRVWLVITFMDNLEKEHLFGDKFGKTVFDNLAAMLQSLNLPGLQKQVLLIGNKFFQRLQQPDGTTRVPRAIDFEWLGLQISSTGEAVLPEKLAMHPGLKSLYSDSLLVDGGIGRLRELIRLRLATAVEGQVRSDVARDMDDAAAALDLQVGFAEAQDSQNLDDVEAAMTWFQAVDTSVGPIQRDPKLGLEPATQLLQFLSSAVKKLSNPNNKPDGIWQQITPAQLYSQHTEQYLPLLIEKSRSLLAASVLKATLDDFERCLRLHVGPETLPQLTVEGREPLTFWRMRCESELTDLTEFEGLINEIDDSLDASLSQPRRKLGPDDEIFKSCSDYVAMMTTKVAVVAHRIVGLACDRYLNHLLELLKQLHFMSRVRRRAQRPNKAVFGEVRSALGRCRDRLKKCKGGSES